MLRAIIDWLKRTVITTAIAELKTELDSAGAVATDPPVLTLDVESTPAITKPARKKAAKK